MNAEIKKWLADYFKTDIEDVSELLDNEIARYFLIIWSIYEVKHFKGYATMGKIEKFVEKIEKNTSQSAIEANAKYFHNRYINKRRYSNLLHIQVNPKFEEIIGKDYSSLIINEKLYLLAYVIYRYRNNIFHGNKGVRSWLQYEKQIEKCIQTMQLFINAVS